MSGNNAEKVMLDWDRNNIEGAKLLKLGFEHLRIGLDNIEEAVVLVSYNHSYIDLFKKLTGKNI